MAKESVTNADESVGEALLLYLFFMGKVQAFGYTRAELRSVPTQLAAPKPRPKYAVIRFYPVVEALMASL